VLIARHIALVVGFDENVGETMLQHPVDAS
jgi:hypothetical protein